MQLKLTEATKLITKILLITIFYKLETYKGDPDAYMQMVHPWFTAEQAAEKRTTARKFWATMYYLRVTHCQKNM